MRKPHSGFPTRSDTKTGCTSTEDGKMLEISDAGTSYEAKTKALISFAVTAKLICVFVFAYAKSRFSHNEAQINYHIRSIYRTTQLVQLLLQKRIHVYPFNG